MVWSSIICISVGPCGKAMCRDLWSSFHFSKEEIYLWLFPLCLGQQSKLHVLLLNTWCFHGKWDGK
jgi:hypothetical protein